MKIIELGKIPPQSIEIEKTILGTFIAEPDAYLLNPVNPDLFYLDAAHDEESVYNDLKTWVPNFNEKTIIC